MTSWLLRRLDDVDPAVRRLWAARLLIASFVLAHTNIGAFFAGLISEQLMNAVTNYLSWLALTITAADVLMTTDVRKTQEDEE